MERFFSFDARVTRSRLLGGVLLALILAWIAVLLLRSGTPSILVTVGALGGVVVAKLLVEAVRRRHDMGASGTGAVLLLVGGAVVASAALIYALGKGPVYVFHATILLLALCWAALLLRPGNPGANTYGPPPSHPLVPAFGERRRLHGVVVAMFLTVLGAATGYAGACWIEGMRSRHASDERQAEIEAARHSAAPDALERIYRERNGQ